MNFAVTLNIELYMS